MARLYHRDEAAGIDVWHGECRDVLPLLGAFDHIITDPPYAEETHEGARTGKDGGARLSKALVDFEAISEEELRAVLDELAGHCRRWLIATMDHRHVFALEAVPPPGWRFVRWGIWVKPNGTPQKTGDRPSQGFETIAFMCQADNDAYLADVEACAVVAIMHRLMPAGQRRMIWNGGGRSAVFIHPKVTSNHPTGKPEALVADFVNLFTRPGESVLDPYGGGGTTAAVCKMLGRRCTIIEREERHCRAIVERLAGIPIPMLATVAPPQQLAITLRPTN